MTDKSHNKGKRLALRMLIALPFFFLAAAGPEVERVQVIVASRPLVDGFERLTLVARTADGHVDVGYRGEVCLWTDGYRMRPSRVKFRSQDKGIMDIPVMLELPRLTRIEAYRPGSSLHAWSNPILPRDSYDGEYKFFGVLPDNSNNHAPPLYWGKMDACEEPGLDFCIATGAGKAGHGEQAILQAVRKSVEGATWIVVFDPGLENNVKKKIRHSVEKARDRRELYSALYRFSNKTANICVLEKHDSKSGFTSKPGEREPIPPISVLVLPPDAEKENYVPRNLTRLSALALQSLQKIPAVLPGQKPLLGVWSRDRSPQELWKGLRESRCYGSLKGRPLLYYSRPPSGSRPEITIAGHGPHELANLYQWDGKQAKPVSTRKSNHFRLTLPMNRDKKKLYFLEVKEGGGNHGYALAGPVPDFYLKSRW